MATTMTYGAYNFRPVPMMNMSIENQKTQDGTILGKTFRVTLDGTVSPLPTGTAGYVNTDALQDVLIDAMSIDGKRFHIACGGADILDVYPRVNTISFEPTSNNWVNTADYTIEIEFDQNTTGDNSPYITDASEDWNLEFMDNKKHFSSDLSAVTTQYTDNYYALDTNPYILRLTHNVSAVGKSYYSSTGVADEIGTLGRAGWQEAQEYVIGKLGADNTFLEASGVVNLDVSQFQYYDHIRSQIVNELGGSFSVVESWIVVNPSGSGIPGHVLEDFNIDVNKSIDSDLTTVAINGSVEGLSTINYGTTTGDYTVDESKYAAAQSGWATIQNRLLPRAQLVSQSLTTRPLNSGVRNTTIGHNPTQGIISYNYNYDDRPTNCIAGALSENISIVDNNPTDVFASLTVLGRAAGPILQDIGTKTSATRDVSIEAVMTIPTGCTVANLLTNRPTTEVDALLCTFELDLSGDFTQVFLQGDTESWNPKTGQYSRQVRWVFEDCSGNANTTFCS